ncbi:MAG: peptidase MA family metallohydrolase [Gemmatimonadota bacterium]
MAGRRRIATLVVLASCFLAPRELPGQVPDTIRAGPLVAIHWPGGERLARRVLDRVLAMPPLPALPEGVLDGDDPVWIYFAPDAERFDSLTGGRAPEWGAGIAFPDAGVIVLPAYFSRRGAPHELARTLRHELAHIALHRYLDPARPPRWFDEGYARIAAGEWDLEAGWQLRLAFATGRAPHLDSLALEWPAREIEARVAYLLASSAVGYLLDRGGERALRIFLERWKETGSIESALRRTYGLTVGQFEEDWSASVRKEFGWTYVLVYSAVFWSITGVLLLFLYLRRRRYQLRRLEALRVTDPPDAPAYWMGEEAPGTGGGGSGMGEGAAGLRGGSLGSDADTSTLGADALGREGAGPNGSDAPRPGPNARPADPDASAGNRRE